MAVVGNISLADSHVTISLKRQCVLKVKTERIPSSGFQGFDSLPKENANVIFKPIQHLKLMVASG